MGKERPTAHPSHPVPDHILAKITDRVGENKEVLARQSNNKLMQDCWRGVFESSAIGIAVCNVMGRFVATNPAFQQMLGYTDEELRELSSRHITFEGDRETNQRLVNELLAGQRTHFEMEKRYRGKDGRLIWAKL